MKIPLRKFFYLVLALGLFLPLSTFGQGKEDKRQYRKFKLKNGLKVVLVSDSDVNTSAASMSIAVGSLADPKNRQGMAHFLEHMLFLGTEKYPKLNAYGEYLKSRGGYSNAYTAPDHTNYHFQVNHDGLPEALDRFSQFFISPLLDYQHAKREMKAVHSEHQKNIPKDNWRLIQLQRSMLKKGHPASKFHTGNLKTLGETKEKELKEFFEDYYSAHRMALCVISPLSLDRMEKLVKGKFAAIPRRKVDEFEVSSQILEEEDTLRMIKVKPVRDIRQLKLYFPVPSQHDKVLSKTSKIVGMTMGDEGKGSLLSLLKKKGLATSLSAGIGNDTRFYSSCRVTVELTKKGLKMYKKVLKLCFSYIQLLKEQKFPRYIWKEMKTMASLEQLYSPKGEGTSAAIEIANNANEHGLEVAEKVKYLFTEPDEKNYRKILGALRPSNMLAFLVAKGVKTSEKETYYGTEYSVTEEKEELFEKLQKVKVHSDLHLPRPNPFVPKNVDVLPEQPVLVAKNPYMTLWYKQDTEFKRPKVALYIHILSPVAYKSARHAALNQLYATLVKEKLNEFAYPAMVAGLSYSLSPSKKGMLLTVQGYSDSAFKLLEIVGRELGKADFKKEVFDSVKEKMVRGLKNYPFSAGYNIARQVAREVMLKKYYLPGEILKVLPSLNLEEVKQFASTLFAKTHIQAMCMGNLTSSQAKKTVKGLIKQLGSRPLNPGKVHQDRILWLQKGDDLVYKKTLVTNNSCLRMDYQMGMADLDTQAAAWIVDRAIKNAFYTEMRTRQGLGYIVFSGSYDREDIQYMVFIIQSGSYPARDLFNRADKYLLKMVENFDKLPDRQFEAIRQSLIKDRKKEAKSIAEKAGMFYTLAFKRKGDFDRRQKEIEALKKVTKKEVIALLKKTLAKDSRRRITYLLNAKQHEKDEKKADIQNVKKFHKGRVFHKVK